MMSTKSNNKKISVSNYGPIEEAKDIELFPLTVFVGPSNTGKSYLAVLIYALLNVLEENNGHARHNNVRALRRRTLLEMESRSPTAAKLEDTDIDDLITEFFDSMGDCSECLLSSLPEKMIKWANKEIVKKINYQFHQEVSRCMGMPVDEKHLVDSGFKICFEDEAKKFSLTSLNATPNMEIKQLDVDVEYPLENDLFREDRQNFPNNIKRHLFIDMVLGHVFPSRLPTESFYLPAGRTGIMQSHRAIAGALVHQASAARMDAISMPTLNGILSDFIQEIIFMDSSEVIDNNTGKVADKMEQEILCGSIELNSSETNQYPQVSYKQKELEIPLLHSSSMVSELAPVVLFIRHRVTKGDLLIIEEPESHLHPAAQKNIAKIIVQLIRVGIRVLVTTHSDYLVDQLTLQVLSSKLKADKGTTLVENTLLAEEEIGVYEFNQHNNGTIVKKIELDKKIGYTLEGHDKVSSDLYDETIDILSKLDEQG